uniref:Uncharacterized protein n=1 Tax=Panagrolaimus davidi TaxID=227884 RepID=A0A914Q9F5_9BILA
MDWNAIRKYFGFESDFTAEERKIILESEKLEYLLSINTKNFTFPFPNKNIYSLKTDFSTPMNILISRIIQRSNPEISHLLSLINKTIKNEIDRYPIKLLEFCAYENGWILDLNTKRGFRHFLKFDEFKEIYFDALKKRKDYMEDDGIIGSSDVFFGNLKPTVKDRFLSYYPVSDINEIIKI